MFGSGYENCPEIGVLGGAIFKLDILQTGRKITVLQERFRLHLPHIIEKKITPRKIVFCLSYYTCQHGNGF